MEHSQAPEFGAISVSNVFLSSCQNRQRLLGVKYTVGIYFHTEYSQSVLNVIRFFLKVIYNLKYKEKSHVSVLASAVHILKLERYRED
jgi:hypothetical protein